MINIGIIAILYEYQFNLGDFSMILIFSIILIVLPIYFYVKHIRSNKKHNNNKTVSLDKKIALGFCLFAALVGLFIGGGICAGQIITYTENVQIIENGTYEVVIGKVVNFNPMPMEGHQDESFTVDGIEFSYSSGVNGYNDTFYYDGVIRENGQMVKIWYYFDGERNVILRIESVESSDIAMQVESYNQKKILKKYNDAISDRRGVIAMTLNEDELSEEFNVVPWITYPYAYPIMFSNAC